MKFQESESVELKSIVQDDIKKEIIAFANCNGGTIYVGITDQGEIIGVENADDSALQISNMVRDSVKPDVTMFIHYETLELERKSVIAVHIQRGTNRPYYLAKKGLRPEGVYVRQGYSSVPASDTAIRQMIKETDGDSFEEMRSINQALSFDVLRQEFKTRKISFAQAQMQTLHMQSADKLYTNLALLLSDQCPYSIKVAVFESGTETVFKDRREFSGSLMQQLHDVYDYIDLHNQVHASFDKLLRIDNRDYPEVAVREALLNSLVHRDYSFHAATLISIYPDHMEFVTLGGLPTGLELEDIKLGISVCRNPHLANVFYRLQLIEAYGTGIKKIMDSYFGKGKQPSIICSNNAFKIILPNTNAGQIVKEDSVIYSVTPYSIAPSFVEPSFVAPSFVAPSSALPSAEEQILQVLSRQKEITRREVQELLEVSQSTAGRILKTMVDRGQIIKLGGSLTTRYRAVR